MAMNLDQVRALEELHDIISTGRRRKRKVIRIDPAKAERYEEALKAAMPPVF